MLFYDHREVLVSVIQQTGPSSVAEPKILPSEA